MSKLIPYDYQQEAVDSVFSYLKLTKENPLESYPLIQAPTGSGKSLIQALCIEKIRILKKESKILCLCHSTDIIEQNYNEFTSYSDEKDVGIYCSTLGRKEYKSILFSSIQSAANSKLQDQFFDILFIDEAHLCNNKEEGQYRNFINKIKKINPKLRIIGLTATPWRMDGGCLIHGDDRLFSAIVYSIPLKLLIERGKLVPVVTPEQDILVQPDLTDLVYSNATKDYTIKSQSSIIEKKLEDCILEAVKIFKERNHILVFAPSIKTAHKVIEELKKHGEECRIYIGGSTKNKNEKNRKYFENGKFKYLVTVGKATTGFNVKCIDGLLCLRMTKSSSLWVQMIGRGARLFLHKINCLLLDYGGNIDRHGPVESIEAPPVKSKKGNGTFEMVKICPVCHMEIHMSRKECNFCGYPFPIIERKYKSLCVGQDVLFDKSNQQKIENIIIIDSENKIYINKKGEKSINFSYVANDGRIINEWLKLNREHGGYHIRKMTDRIIKIFYSSLLAEVDFSKRDRIVDDLTKLINICDIELFYDTLCNRTKEIENEYKIQSIRILTPSNIDAVINEKYKGTYKVKDCYFYSDED